jgi:hypothetical protein
VFVALLVLVGGPSNAATGTWSLTNTLESDSPPAGFNCDDVLRPGSVSATATAALSGVMTATSAAGILAPGTEPPVGVIVHPQSPIPDVAGICFGVGGSKALADGYLRALVDWPGAGTSSVTVPVTGIAVAGAVTDPSLSQRGVIGADAAWHVLSGIQVTYYACATPAGATAPPCAASTPVLSDVEDIMRSTTFGLAPTAVDLCVSDFLSAVATLPGTIVVDASLSAFNIARGDGASTASAVATYGTPVLSATVCPSFPLESLTDGDSES